jgi:hypothetical protein
LTRKIFGIGSGGDPRREYMLRLLTVGPVPADTMRVAKDAIPESNTCMALRDRLKAIFDDALFVPLFPTRGQQV